MTEAPVPLAAKIEKVRREIDYARADHAERAERLWSAVLATLQQHERAMAVVEAARKIQALRYGEAETLDQFKVLDALDIALAALDDAASAAATPAGKPW